MRDCYMLFFVFRFGGVEDFRMKDVRIGLGTDGDTTISIHIRASKTDRYNESPFKALNGEGGSFRPGEMRSS